MAILLILLSAVALAALPVLPETETASAELNPAEVETAGTLLGENSPELQAPSGEVRPTSGRRAAGTVTLTVPKLGLEDIAVPTGSSQAELDLMREELGGFATDRIYQESLAVVASLFGGETR